MEGGGGGGEAKKGGGGGGSENVEKGKGREKKQHTFFLLLGFCSFTAKPSKARILTFDNIVFIFLTANRVCLNFCPFKTPRFNLKSQLLVVPTIHGFQSSQQAAS